MAFGPVSLRVVIRFQICIFDILNTACIDEIPDIVEL